MPKVSQEDLTSPVYEKGYPSYEAVNREGYYDYMKRRSREEDEKLRIDNNTAYPYKGWSQDAVVSDLRKRADQLRKDIDAYIHGEKH